MMKSNVVTLLQPVMGITDSLWSRLVLWFGTFAFFCAFLGVCGLEVYIYYDEYQTAKAGGPESMALLLEFYAEIVGVDQSELHFFHAPIKLVLQDIWKIFIWLLLPVVLPLTLIGTGLVARNLTRPISSVGSAARKIVEGDLTARVDKSGMHVASGELGDLIDDFNAMAGSLEAAERRLKKDAASIAHELQSPISVLNIKLHSFLDGVTAPDEGQYRMLLEQTELLSRIVDDLRTVSLAACGDLVLNRKPVELSEMAHTVLSVQRERLDKVGIKPQVRGTSIEVLADPERMVQALSNLVENAIRYAASGGELDICTKRDGDKAVIEVSDRGAGLAGCRTDNLFHPFKRGNEALCRDHDGSGLGLSVVAAIASAHGGSAEAVERPGGGLTVSMTLPAAT